MINAGLYCRHGRARGQAGKFWHQRPLSGLTWIIISPFPPPLSSSSMQCRLREDLVYNLGWILGNFLNWAHPKLFQNLNFVKKSAIIFFDEINLEPPIHFGTPKEKIRSWELYDHGSELLWHLRSNFGLKCSKLCHPFFTPSTVYRNSQRQMIALKYCFVCTVITIQTLAQANILARQMKWHLVNLTI